MNDGSGRLLELSRSLRKARLAAERLGAPQYGPAQRPDLYYDYAPCGRYPIIALRTVPCDRYVKGMCLPCAYSARPYVSGLGRETLYAGLERQVEWVLDNFDEVVANKASGRLDDYHLRQGLPDRPWYTLQLAGESSFFRDAEIPPAWRRWILERLVEFQEDRQINLHLMLECRPEDLLAAHESGELVQLRPLFRRLDVVVNMGLEYRDDWLRNRLFAKGLDLDTFERAVQVAHSHRLDPGVFVFAGAPVLTAAEILRETRYTLKYLERLRVFANLMVPNLQAGTLPDLLWEEGLYELPEPFFLLELADLAIDYHPYRPAPITPFDWFIGGLESDPPPRYTILDQPRRTTSDALTQEIHRVVLDLVTTLNVDTYRARAAHLREHPEAKAWREALQQTDPRSWDIRLSEILAELPAARTDGSTRDILRAG